MKLFMKCRSHYRLLKPLCNCNMPQFHHIVPGISDKKNLEAYNSLWKCRSFWNMAMLQFQKMRNPPRCLSLDESMSKFTVSFRPLRRTTWYQRLCIIQGRCKHKVILKRKPGLFYVLGIDMNVRWIDMNTNCSLGVNHVGNSDIRYGSNISHPHVADGHRQ